MADLSTQLSAMIAQLTDGDPADLHPESRFDGLDGWSSMQALALMVDIEEHLPVKLDLRPFMAVRTVGELTALVAKHLEQSGTPAP